MEKKSDSLIYLALTITVLTIGGYFLLKNLKVEKLPQVLDQKNAFLEKTQEETAKVNVWEGDLPAWGSLSAPVKVIEFGDFHCPFCVLTAVEFYPQIKKYIDNGEVVFYFRDFPIPQLHPQAFLAHLASRCADEQGKYWEFHKRLFEDYYQKVMVNRESNFATERESYLNYLNNLAKELGLNTSQFKECLTTQKYKDKIERDINEGNSLGVKGTPTFFVNGEMVEGANFEGLKIKIEKYLKK